MFIASTRHAAVFATGFLLLSMAWMLNIWSLRDLLHLSASLNQAGNNSVLSLAKPRTVLPCCAGSWALT